MNKYQNSKRIVREYFDIVEKTTAADLIPAVKAFTGENYRWRGVYPFRELNGVEETVNVFWSPLKTAVTHLQRRQDIFIAGTNEISNDEWVMSMGHFMGLFDSEWLGIRPTGKLITLRYAEFSRIEADKIAETGLFVDVLGFMVQAGVNPLPPSTGQYFVYPGPRNHDGLLFDDAPEEESARTLDLVDRMLDDLIELNESGSMGCPPEILRKTWAEDMLWYGPAGIGASYTIPRYQQQHQLPFRGSLTSKKFNGHVCRFAEGNFSCFFGWPNLTNTPIGGFLGLPGGKVSADMQVVDVYCRRGDKLLENWILIDLPYWLKQQGLDILERNRIINRA